MPGLFASYSRGELARFAFTTFTIVLATQIYSVVGNHPRLALLYAPLLAIATFPFAVFVLLFMVALATLDTRLSPEFTGSLGLYLQTILVVFLASRNRLVREPNLAQPFGPLHLLVLKALRPAFTCAAFVLALLTLFRSAPALEYAMWSACCAVTAMAIPLPWGFRLRTAWPTVALTCASTIFALGIVEIGARMILPPAQTPSDMYMPDPDYIFSLRPNTKSDFYVRDSEKEGFSVEAVISSQGVRDRVLGPKAPDELRIVMLGDSYTMGHGLQPEQNIPDRLEKKLNAAAPAKKVTVVNCGVGGYAPWQERGFLNARGFQFEPDLVILQVFPANDVPGSLTRVGKYLQVQDLGWELRINEFRRQGEFPVAVQRWLRAHSRAYTALAEVLNEPNLARDIINDLRFVRHKSYPQPTTKVKRNPYREASLIEWYPELEEAYQLLEQDIRGIRDDCRARGVDLIAYAHPFPLATLADGWASFDAKTLGTLFERNKDVRVTQEIFARLEIPYVDVTAALESQPDQSALYFRYDGHFTPEGAEVVARAIADFLLSKNYQSAAWPGVGH